MGNVAFALKNINHPPVVGSYRLDKIFGDMTARWTDFPPAISDALHCQKKRDG